MGVVLKHKKADIQKKENKTKVCQNLEMISKNGLIETDNWGITDWDSRETPNRRLDRHLKWLTEMVDSHMDNKAWTSPPFTMA